MTLDEIKQKMHEVVDKAWEALHGTHDLDEARKVAQEATAELQAQVLQVEAHLFNHVADNAAEAAKTESAPAADGAEEAAVKTEQPDAAKDSAPPTDKPTDKPSAAASPKKAAK